MRVLPFRFWMLSLGGLLASGQTPAQEKSAKKESKEATQTASAPAATLAVPALDAKALGELTLEESRVRDSLSATEARLMVLSERLFSSRLRVQCRSDIPKGFQLARVELLLDGETAYHQEIRAAATVQVLTLFDGFLVPGRHTLELRVYARGRDDPSPSWPGYFAGGGLAVHLREKARTEARFEVEASGASPSPKDLTRSDPRGEWELEIHSAWETINR